MPQTEMGEDRYGERAYSKSNGQNGTYLHAWLHYNWSQVHLQSRGRTLHRYAGIVRECPHHAGLSVSLALETVLYAQAPGIVQVYVSPAMSRYQQPWPGDCQTVYQPDT